MDGVAVIPPISLLQTGALLGLLLLVIRRGQGSGVPLAGAALGLAIVAQPLRSATIPGVLPLFMLALAVLGVSAVALGLYLRGEDAGRMRERDAVRAEFARDLHDFVAHHVTGIVVLAQGARIAAEREPLTVVPALARIESAGGEALTAMRRMVAVLREPGTPGPAPTAPLADLTHVPAMVDRFNATGSPAATLHLEGDVGDLPVDVSATAAHVAMEALSNVRQHAAGATAVTVSVRRRRSTVEVVVADDGHGATTGGREGFGLAGTAERVGLVGGRFSAGPRRGRGWEVTARIPVADARP
jgi:signal transduction histidine kinase